MSIGDVDVDGDKVLLGVGRKVGTVT